MGSFLLDDVVTGCLMRRCVPRVFTRIGASLGYIAREFQASGIESSPFEALVVLGTHSRKGLDRALLGSVALGVLHHAPCPVLIAPVI